MTAAITSNVPVASTAPSGATSTTASDQTASQDRFLKLLVAQLNNQDPMNPMDNAQMTTQLAQINTVSGIEKLNQTVQGLVAQFSSMQMMQGSAMVGHSVLTSGNVIEKSDKVGTGTVDLVGDATSVSIQVLDSNGAIMDTVNMGERSAGRHTFETDLSKYASSGELTFKVIAQKGTQTVEATTLMSNKVTSIGSSASGITIGLSNGKSVAYDAIKAVL